MGRLQTWLLLGITFTSAAACAPQTARHGAAPASHVSAQVAPSRSPKPPVKAPPAKPLCPQRMGGTIALQDSHTGASLRLTVGQASSSTTSLSASYGDPPRNGRYLTVHVRVTATGDQPVQVGPDDFYVQQTGRPHTTTNDGNGEYSGASDALGATAADPGETVTGPLTFDIPRNPGLVVYAPNAKPTCSWRF